MSDPAKKTLRHFYCRDGIWQSFEAMSEALDAGIDSLVNEAMEQFARDKGYAIGAPGRAPGAPVINRETNVRSVPGFGGPPAPPSQGAALQARPTVVPTPPPLPTARGTTEETPAELPSPLFLIFDNREFIVDAEQFIIGRGSKSADLVIRDGNISRKHAAVVRRDGGYFIKDLGSTNGIDHEGTRIDSKRIEEGDVFFLCDYQLRFSFQSQDSDRSLSDTVDETAEAAAAASEKASNGPSEEATSEQASSGDSSGASSQASSAASTKSAEQSSG